MTVSLNLSGKFLIATPGMGDPRFEHSVILICAHSDDGAMGLIVNKPADEVTFPDLLKQLGIEDEGQGSAPPICLGGPVEHARGFVLHSMDYDRSDTTLEVPGGYGMTATLDILQDIAGGRGPARAMLALGYSGWAPGQLEAEIADNGWLIGDASPELIFDIEAPKRWTKALENMGVDALALSATAGRA